MDLPNGFKYIDGYEGLYAINRKGDILSFHRGLVRTVVHSVSKDGHHSVLLASGAVRSRRSVHKLVAKAFLPNPDGLDRVRTKDGDLDNLDADNLEWFRPGEHLNTAECRKQIAEKLREGWKSGKYDDSTKRKMLEAHRRKVSAYDDEGMVATFRSITDAKLMTRANGIPQAIRTGCKSGGYYWKREEKAE